MRGQNTETYQASGAWRKAYFLFFFCLFENTGDGGISPPPVYVGDIQFVVPDLAVFPVLVVATKLDRLKAEQSKSGNIRTVQQRNVLGLPLTATRLWWATRRGCCSAS